MSATKTPLCGTCGDREGVVCDRCGNGLVPADQRRVPFLNNRLTEQRPDELRAALEDAAESLWLGMTWITDTDRHNKMRRAWKRAREALQP